MANRNDYDAPVKDSDRMGWWRRVIGACNGNGILLTRYYILDTKWLGIYVHRFHQSDEDRANHDHPWDFVTFLFHRGYWESVGKSATAMPVYRPRWSVLYRKAEFTHRVITFEPVWTLVVRFRERRAWGFWPEGKWMRFTEYGRRFCK